MPQVVSIFVREGDQLHAKSSHLQVVIGEDKRELNCQTPHHVWDTPLIFHDVPDDATIKFLLLSKSILRLSFLDDELGTAIIELKDEPGDERWVTLYDEKGVAAGDVRLRIDVDGRAPLFGSSETPDSRKMPFEVIVKKGEVLKNSRYYSLWGDLVVTLQCGATSLKTQHQTRTSEPEWNETFQFQMSHTDPLLVSLIDVDWGGVQNVLGTKTLTAAELRVARDLTVTLLDPYSNDSVARLLLSTSCESAVSEDSSSSKRSPSPPPPVPPPRAPTDFDVDSDSVHSIRPRLSTVQKLLVRVLRGRDLRLPGIMATQAAYVALKLGATSWHTTAQHPVEPVWEEDFEFPYETPDDVLQVILMDKDALYNDPLGKAEVAVKELTGRHNAGLWVCLKDSKGQYAGEVLLSTNAGQRLARSSASRLTGASASPLMDEPRATRPPSKVPSKPASHRAAPEGEPRPQRVHSGAFQSTLSETQGSSSSSSSAVLSPRPRPSHRSASPRPPTAPAPPSRGPSAQSPTSTTRATPPKPRTPPSPPAAMGVGPSDVVPVRVVRATGLAAVGDAAVCDPYVVLRLGDQMEVTHTKAMTTEPVWNEDFRLRVFRNLELEVAVMSRGVGEQDRPLGSATIPALELLSGKREAWVPLELNGRYSGDLCLSLSASPLRYYSRPRRHEHLSVADEDDGPPFPKAPPGRGDSLMMYIIKATGLPLLEHRHCRPFVRLQVGQVTHETRLASRMVDPVWREAVPVRLLAGDVLEVRVLASDGQRSWELCAGRVAGRTVLAKRGRELWLTLIDVKDGLHSVPSNSSLLLGIDLPRQAPRPGDPKVLPLRVSRASHLPKGQRVGNPDPYVEIWLRGHSKRTSVQYNTRNPVWEEQFSLTVRPDDSLKFVVLDRAPYGRDAVLCSAHVKGKQLLLRRGQQVRAVLKDAQGHLCGSLFLVLRPEDAPNVREADVVPINRWSGTEPTSAAVPGEPLAVEAAPYSLARTLPLEATLEGEDLLDAEEWSRHGRHFGGSIVVNPKVASIDLVHVPSVLNEWPTNAVAITVVSARSDVVPTLESPFVVLHVGRTLRTTAVAVDSPQPTWHEEFGCQLGRRDTLRIELKGKRSVVDQTLGVADVSGAELQACEGQEIDVDLVHPLYPAQVVGSVRLQIRSVPFEAEFPASEVHTKFQFSGRHIASAADALLAAPQPPEVTNATQTSVRLPVNVRRARGLPEPFGRPIMPYVVLRLGLVTKKTATDPKGGPTPVWNEDFVFTVDPEDVLDVSVEDDDPGCEESLGRASVRGRDLLLEAGREVWVPLVDPTGGLDAGELLLAIGHGGLEHVTSKPRKHYTPPRGREERFTALGCDRTEYAEPALPPAPPAPSRVVYHGPRTYHLSPPRPPTVVRETVRCVSPTRVIRYTSSPVRHRVVGYG